MILVYHDVCLCLCGLAGDSNVGEDGQVRELGNVVVALNLVAEEIDEVDNACRNYAAQHKCDEHNDRTLGADLSSVLRFVDELALVGSGSK